MHQYPRHMTFFSTAANIEIGGFPFTCVGPKPTRDEALEYYRSVAQAAHLHLELYRRVERIDGEAGAFTVVTNKGLLHARYVICASGFFHHPVRLGIPGEDQAHVSHYFDDGHRYFDQDLVIVAGQTRL